MKQSAIVLLSGGLDSTTILAIVKSQGFEVYALSFSYGQRHSVELESAIQSAKYHGPVREHKIVNIDLRTFGGSSLTSDIPIPKHTDISHLENGEIPTTYVPARNTIFLSYALAYAEVIGADHIFIGANAVDYSNYPDCRSEYIKAYEAMANLASARAVSGNRMHLVAPIMHMKKSEVISAGLKLGVDYGLTTSCYDAKIIGRACGACDSCLLRRAAFNDLGIQDPVQYDSIS